MSNRTKLLEKSLNKSIGIIGRLTGSVNKYRGFSWAFLAILMLTVSVQQSSAQITTQDFGPVSYCPGTVLTVSYTVTGGGPMASGNEFRVQLSDASGNFINNNNSSNIIGTLASTALSGTINATIPPTTPPSTTYRVRVVSTNPAMNHTTPYDDNGNNITIISRTITPSYPTLTNINVGNSVSVPFTVNCNYISGNNFILELSDRTGNFSASGYPRTVATLVSFSNGTLTGNIPSVPSGSGYRLRIRSTNTASISAVSSAFAINPVLTSTECVCNNDQTPNLNDGTYAVTLIISNADGSAMGAGESYRIASSTSLRNTSNGTLGNPSFIYCDGLGCPSGVDAGEYYLRVYVENNAAFTVNVDGPDADNNSDFSLSTSCGTLSLYPPIPTFPSELMNVNCLQPGTNTFTNPTMSVFSRTNSIPGRSLYDGFYQTVTGNTGGNLTIENGEVNETINSSNPFFQLYMIRQATNDCRVSAVESFKVYNALSAEIVNLPIFCRAPRERDSISLELMFGSETSSGGTFSIPGVTIVNNKVPVNNGICHQVTYSVTDSCGVVLTDTKSIQVTVRPAPQFNFDAGQPASPLCATSPTTLTITRTSTGFNPNYTVSTNNINYPVTSISGNGTDHVTIVLPEIPHNAMSTTSVRYTICLQETNNTPPSCGSITPPTEPCAETFCRTYIIYRDRYNCGADNLFPNQCDTYYPDVCFLATKPNLEAGCTYFTLQGPNILTSVVNFDNGGVVGCKQDSIRGNFNVSFLGFDANQIGGQRKLSSFPGMNVICSIFGFEICFIDCWRPLGALHNLLGCDKTIAQFILGLISQLVGGDGGGYLVMADTDGDGAFDYLIEDGFFPSGSNSFSIPNRVRGSGAITVRAVGGWANAPSDVCGDLGIEPINLIDLLPIGAIPIVGAVIEDILAAASCNINLTFSVEATEKIQVLNDEPAIYVNCNESGYVFAQTLECNIPVSWSVPVAVDGCGGSEPIPFKGYLENPTTDVTLFAGTNPPPSFTAITEPGIYQISGPLPGSILTPGTYPVSYQAVSCNGIPSVCAFNVEVTSGDPILECPQDLTISTDVDLCSAVVTGLAPYQGIGCSSIINYRFTNPVSGTVVETNDTGIGIHNVPDGYAFELGTTVITYTMQVDINGDGDYDDPGETQQCDFSITVEDNQLPNAVCLTVQLHLNNEGAGTVYASDIQDSIYIDGGSTDNCFGNLLLEISRNGIDYAPSVDFDCDDKGQRIVRLRVTDASGNVSICKGVVQVLDYFEGYKLDLDVPEVCFEPFQNQFDFSPYIVIAQPDGTNIKHQDVGTLGSRIEGGFGISAFLPDAGSTNDPGTITPDGVYTLGTGTGWITISYVLSIDGQVNQYDEDNPLVGCFRMVHDVFRVEKLDPVWKAGYMCCDQLPVWLGGAAWDGTGAPPIPAGMLSLTDIRGAYPGDVYGEWIGQGVSFVDPDGIPYSGDEFFMFDPNGLDGSYSLTYIIGDEPCEFKFTQEILVTCQDLHVDISDYTVCPANWVEEKQVLVNLDDKDLVVSTTGFDQIGADGGHYADGTPVRDLDSVIVVDGRVVIPGFFAPVIRSKSYEICVTTFQVTPFGCADVFCYTITVEDLLAPDFQNCPRDPIVVDAPQGWCSSFVNFELPWAFDNCMGLYARIERGDSTGLNSGDLFPVGLTILSYLATDTVGNQSYCELKIIVNDYHTPPSIVCPDDVTQVNDLEKCGAVVNDIAPVKVEDNCPDNLTILYEVTDPDGNVVACGLEDASGEFFPVGTSSVKYRVEDQPLILITEIVQDGVITGMEITNFGPADMDITCSNFVLKDQAGNVIETYMVPTANNKSTYGTTPIYPPDPILWVIPNPNVIPAGGTFTHTFTTNIPQGQIAKYCFTFLNRIIDEATINDLVKGDVILRKNVCDHDTQTDFIAATPCDPGSFGFLNPGLPFMTPNGTVRGLQNYAPSVAECRFTVTINDLEAPYCIRHDSILVVNNTVPELIDVNACMVSKVTMPAGIVNDVNIFNLGVTIPNAGAVTAYLSSPSGTRIRLFSEVCMNQPNIDINLDETIVWTPAPSVNGALCNPMGQGGTYRPAESFKAFFGEQAAGDWTLEIFTTGAVAGTLTSWELQILYQLPYDQGDVVLQNAPGQCDTTFTWVHPILKDNCCFGTITVDYIFTNDVTGETSTETVVILNSNGTINLQGLSETRIFKVGVTRIEYTLTDQYGNLNTCGFTVTVLDTEEPMFTIGCPDREIHLGPGECLGRLDFFTPPATDNCGIDKIEYYFADGSLADISQLPIGSYTVEMRVKDIYGNVGICIFNVTVYEYQPTGNTLTCNNSLNISLGPDCETVLNADMILEGNNYRCYDNYCISIEDEFGIPHANLFTLDDEGKRFKVSIIDCLSGSSNSCWGYVIIEEKLWPQIECPEDLTVACNFDIEAVDSLGHLLTGEAILVSCEREAKIAYQDEWTTFGICDNPRAIVTRTWSVIDDEGHKSECIQTFTIRRLDLDDVEYPEDIEFNQAINCADVINNPALTHPDHTGWPLLNGIKVNQSGSLCMVSLNYTDEIYDICEGSYEILRYWKVRNMCLPVTPDNPRTHVQVIKVLDVMGPKIIDCPIDMTVSVDPWNCRSSLELPLPGQVLDACSGEFQFRYLIYGGGELKLHTDSLGNPHIFANYLNKGLHTIKYLYKDKCGNQSECSFKVNVVDATAPIAIAKQNVVMSLTGG
ncbi:MAG: HYR domain-containing protein, partial [Chitinophagales bacterium]|nr:HYR domain-containing protein [Chitinophagales bacterium]